MPASDCTNELTHTHIHKKPRPKPYIQDPNPDCSDVSIPVARHFDRALFTLIQVRVSAYCACRGRMVDSSIMNKASVLVFLFCQCLMFPLLNSGLVGMIAVCHGRLLGVGCGAQTHDWI